MILKRFTDCFSQQVKSPLLNYRFPFRVKPHCNPSSLSFADSPKSVKDPLLKLMMHNQANIPLAIMSYAKIAHSEDIDSLLTLLAIPQVTPENKILVLDAIGKIGAKDKSLLKSRDSRLMNTVAALAADNKSSLDLQRAGLRCLAKYFGDESITLLEAYYLRYKTHTSIGNQLTPEETAQMCAFIIHLLGSIDTKDIGSTAEVHNFIKELRGRPVSPWELAAIVSTMKDCDKIIGILNVVIKKIAQSGIAAIIIGCFTLL